MVRITVIILFILQVLYKINIQMTLIMMAQH